jgi:hypothetical protein
MENTDATPNQNPIEALVNGMEIRGRENTPTPHGPTTGLEIRWSYRRPGPGSRLEWTPWLLQEHETWLRALQGLLQQISDQTSGESPTDAAH